MPCTRIRELIAELGYEGGKTAFLDQGHIRTVCTRVQFAAKACPPGAVYGHVKPSPRCSANR